MVEGTATLVLDLGNSETRVRTYFGKNAKGNPRCRQTILENNYAKANDKELPNILHNEAYTEDNSKVFVCNGLTYCNGLVCNREFIGKMIRPSANQKKYAAITTKLALINAFRQGFEDVAEFTNSEVSALNIDWNVVVLLPPGDIDEKAQGIKNEEDLSGGAVLAREIKSIKQIDFSLPDMKMDISVNKVLIFPEGFCALIATVFEKKGVIRDGYEYLLDEDSLTLICDIGAGTTDFVLVQGSSVISSSRFTVNKGGNNVHQTVKKHLKDDMGIVVSDSAARLGCEVGFIKDGSSKVDIRELIRDVKEEVSGLLVNGAQEFFEVNSFPVQSISNLLVCGGGSESGEVEGIDPIAEYLIDYMRELSPNIRLVELPKVEIDGEMHKISARLLNITGAGILSE